MKTFIRLSALATALLVVPSLAAAQSGWAEVPDSAMVPGFEMTADQFDDLDVVDGSGNKIGEVEDVLATEGGDASAVGVEFEGFSDYSPGDDVNVIVPLDKLTLTNDQLTLSAPDEIASMETYPD